MFKLIPPAGADIIIDKPESAVEYILGNSNYVLEDCFEKDLDSGDRWVQFRGESYRPSELLRCLPDIWQVEFDFWYAKEYQDLVERLEKLTEGDYDCFYGYTIEKI